MLASLTPLISHGVIDNTTRDIVTLRLWGVDGGEPMEFLMQGNCLADIAGSRVSFTNRAHVAPLRSEHPVLKQLRAESAPPLIGDITLSRRVPEPNNRRALSNALSLEFFLGAEMRVLIESTDFTYDLSLPQWQMSAAEANTQAFLNMENLRAHVETNRNNFCGPAMADIRNSHFPACVWDSRLNMAEAGMAIYPTVRDKYRYSPNRLLEEAYVMGRTDILEQKAQEDEAHLPPDTKADNREWEVIDFVAPEFAPAVRKAMHHPLFYETSRLTGLVQTHFMDRRNGSPASQEAERFINGYAAIVSHLLSTLLLTRENDFSVELATRRLNILSRRVANLPALMEKQESEKAVLIREAAAALVSRLDDYIATLQR